MSLYLVTGGLGFIGSHLVDSLLAAGHRVRVVDDLSTGRRDRVAGPIDLLIGSVTDAPLINAAVADIDGCFHLAAVASVARSNEEWRETSAVNLGGTVTVFEAVARRQGGPVPVVYMSSAAVYGDIEALPLSESGPTRPLTAYGADKLACELHAHVAGTVHRVPTFGLRPFNVYGPRQDPQSPYSGVISIFADRARRGLDIAIHGDGHQNRDFVYVADAIRFLSSAMQAAGVSAPVANICTGRTSRIRELAEIILRLTGSPSTIHHTSPRTGDIPRSQGSPALALQLLGIRAETALEDGLLRLLQDAGENI